MKRLFFAVVLASSWLLAQETKGDFVLKDPSQLAGKRVLLVDRIPLCKPGSYNADIQHGGQQAEVVSVKPKPSPAMPANMIARMDPSMRDLFLDLPKTAIVLFKFDDGTQLDSCMPIGPRKLAGYLELASGEKIVPEKDSEPTQTASGIGIQHLSDDEVKSALSGSGKEYWTTITDQNLWSYGGARVQNITIYRAEAVIAQRQESAKKQYLKQYEPSPAERERALIVDAEGQVGEYVNDGCDNLTRVILLSDEAGTMTREAYSTDTSLSQFGNRLGATTQCQGVSAKFSAEDVRAVRQAAKDGEFFIATFAGATKTKIYKIKRKFQSKLNLDQMLLAKN